ncbi:MAG: ferrous iron transport protein A [Candidatus Eremiobacteraeota bacterium]|nr:ferrous iron transport protein A [Candidatus Eremiobacteraeota bacterium]MCW5869910.1 ferrous iron transport protein A [Candidatus Eremiobacteraeota bacterium]
MKPSLTLAQLPLNQPALVERITGPQPFVRRLLSLGVTPGCGVKVVRCAPLGDPIQVEIGRLQLAIRRLEAGQVHLQPSV